MREKLRKLWPAAKLVFTVVILLFVGRQFWRDLTSAEAEKLWQRPPDFGWLALSGVLYLAGLGLSLLFWYRLLNRLGYQPGFLPATRAYYVGHLGKYLPGKAWALALRSILIRGPQVRIGVGVMTSFYEVLTTMTGGVLLAAVLFAFLESDSSGSIVRDVLEYPINLNDPDPAAINRSLLVGFSLALTCVVGFFVLPVVFNRIVRRLVRPLGAPGPSAVPRVSWAAFIEGLGLTALGWLGLGASLWAVLRAIWHGPFSFTLATWGRESAYLALAYVAGFLVLPVPNGIGIREFFLKLFLAHEFAGYMGLDRGEAEARAALAAIVLRVLWLAAEMVIVSVVFWLPGPSPRGLSEERRAIVQGTVA